MKAINVLVLAFLAQSILACASVTKRDERAAIQQAWKLLENGSFDESVRIVRPYLKTRKADLALTIAHIYNERAIQEGNYSLLNRKRDRQCFVSMLERAAILGDLGAASTLSATFYFPNSNVSKDVGRSKCWDYVVEKGKAPTACAREVGFEFCL